MEMPTFATKEARIEWVHKNKDLILAEKRNTIKRADVMTLKAETPLRGSADKSEDENGNGNGEPGKLQVKAVINTTNLIDSHMDCHIPGLWNKSLKDAGVLYWLQEHEMEFEYIIADSVNDGLVASAKTISWQKLGYPFEGNTQALMFEAAISKERNEFMYKQYEKGYVLNHSVGMRYVKLYLCVDSDAPEYAAEKENWNKYIGQVANRDKADEYGYFWAVTEAKIIEGSAVVKGSNYATPTISVGQAKDINNTGAAETGTPKDEPPTGTQNKSTILLTI
jgi:hypothetical protein